MTSQDYFRVEPKTTMLRSDKNLEFHLLYLMTMIKLVLLLTPTDSSKLQSLFQGKYITIRLLEILVWNLSRMFGKLLIIWSISINPLKFHQLLLLRLGILIILVRETSKSWLKELLTMKVSKRVLKKKRQ